MFALGHPVLLELYLGILSTYMVSLMTNGVLIQGSKDWAGCEIGTVLTRDKTKMKQTVHSIHVSL